MTYKPKSLFDCSVPSGTPLFEAPTRVRAASIFSDAKIRKRIDIGVEELRHFHPDVSVLKKAHQQIIQTNVSELCYEFVLNWGADLQKKYADILQSIMELSNHPDILGIKNSVATIIQRLHDLDLVSLNKKSWFTSKEDRIRKMMEEAISLRDVSSLLDPKPLFDLHKANKTIDDTLTKISEEMESYIVTCRFFSAYEKDDFPKELYIGRLSSLLSTKASINNDKQTINLMGNTLLHLIDVANNIARNEIPSWCSNFNSVIAGTMDIDQLHQSKESILSKLKNI